MVRSIATDHSPKAIGPYSQAIQTDSYLFVSGQLPINVSNQEIVKGGVGAQTEQVLKNVREILQASGLSMENVVKCSVFLTSLQQFDEFNEQYSRFFKQPFPARTTVEVSNLPKGAVVEIDVIAQVR